MQVENARSRLRVKIARLEQELIQLCDLKEAMGRPESFHNGEGNQKADFVRKFMSYEKDGTLLSPVFSGRTLEVEVPLVKEDVDDFLGGKTPRGDFERSSVFNL